MPANSTHLEQIAADAQQLSALAGWIPRIVQVARSIEPLVKSPAGTPADLWEFIVQTSYSQWVVSHVESVQAQQIVRWITV